MKEVIYTVKSGESLSKIARDVLGDMSRWKEIAYMNSLSYPYMIKPGQILQLPRDEPLVIEVQGKRTTAAPPADSSTFSFSPATVKLLLVGAALFLFMR